MKKRRIAAALMAVVLVAVGCGNTAETEGQAAQEEAVQEAEPEVEAVEETVAEDVEAGEAESELEEEIPVAVYEEDKNIYGNAIGNLNNEGTFLYNGEDAYAEYQKLGNNGDGGYSALKYLTNWYIGAVKKNPSMVDNYEKQSEEYVGKNVKDRKLDLGILGTV